MDPLIVEGPDIIPTVLEKIENQDNPKRGIAIMFLWNGKYKESIPVLEKILIDEDDPEREAALLSLSGLDEEKGLLYSEKLKNNSDHVGRAAKNIIRTRKGYKADKRTYLQAFLSFYIEPILDD